MPADEGRAIEVRFDISDHTSHALPHLLMRAGDLLLVLGYSADTGGGEAPEIAEVREAAVFQSLGVVQRGEFHVFDRAEMVGAAFEVMTVLWISCARS